MSISQREDPSKQREKGTVPVRTETSVVDTFERRKRNETQDGPKGLRRNVKGRGDPEEIWTDGLPDVRLRKAFNTEHKTEDFDRGTRRGTLKSLHFMKNSNLISSIV